MKAKIPEPTAVRGLRRQLGLTESQFARVLRAAKNPGSDHALDVLELRDRLGLNQAEFAKLVGVSQVTVSRWERGGAISKMALKFLERLGKEVA